VPGAEHRQAAHKLLAAHQIAQAVVLIQIVGNVFAPGLPDAVQLPIAGVGHGVADSAQGLSWESIDSQLMDRRSTTRHS